MEEKTVRAIIIACVAAIGFGFGSAFASAHLADTGDLLAFAGAFIATGASIWGAFAVSRDVARRERREAEELVKSFFEASRRAMIFLEERQRCAPLRESEAEASDRIDRIFASVPKMVQWLIDERVASRTGQPRYMGATLRFVSAMEHVVPLFKEAAHARRNLRKQGHPPIDLSVNVSEDAISEARSACVRALDEIARRADGIAPPALLDEEGPAPVQG